MALRKYSQRSSSGYDRQSPEPALPVFPPPPHPARCADYQAWPAAQSYVVCLDCGRQFEYDLSQMRMGKAIDRSHEAGVLPPDIPTPRKRKVGYALLAAVPAVVVLGAVLTGKKKATKPEGGKVNPAAKGESEARAKG